jgi:N-acetylmuramoyl-L-alanine amidase
MKKIINVLIGLILLIGLTPAPQAGSSQSALPTESQIADYLNQHPLVADSGGEVLNVLIQGEALVINLSQAVLPDGVYDKALFTQLHSDLDQAFNINQLFLTTFKVEGELLEYWGRPLPDFSEKSEPPATREIPVDGPLSGLKIALSPGHGLYWSETYSQWMYQRDEFWGIREDTLNVEIMRYVQFMLESQGATVIQLREFDKYAGTGITGYPKWHESARRYAIAQGLPEWVWDGSNNNYNSDIRARPYMANYYSADILISLHNNGWDGTLRGTETYWDTDNHPDSAALATAVHTSIINTLNNEYGYWYNRGTKASDSNYGEINYAQMAAILIELAFMDNELDNAFLHQESFKQISAKAITEGVCDFFGATCQLNEVDPSLSPAYGSGMCDSGWHRVTNVRGEYTYLALNAQDQAGSTNTALWQMDLPSSGAYKLEAFIPAHGTIQWSCPDVDISQDTRYATYTVQHANGASSIHVNQNNFYDKWVDLGTFHFDAVGGTATASVTLTDVTGETAQTSTVSASALRITLAGNAGLQFYDTAWVPSSWLTEEASTDEQYIRNFFINHNSCLSTPILDSDGVEIDIPQLIQGESAANGINPKLLLALMEAESSALSVCPDQTALAGLMGLEPASTAREQIAGAALQIKTAATTLSENGITPNGWETGVAKATLDGVTVTPANDMITLLFDYAQNAGTVWGGTKASEASVHSIYIAYRDYELDDPLPEYAIKIFIPILLQP